MYICICCYSSRLPIVYVPSSIVLIVKFMEEDDVFLSCDQGLEFYITENSVNQVLEDT